MLEKLSFGKSTGLFCQIKEPSQGVFCQPPEGRHIFLDAFEAKGIANTGTA
jgi:hypothetical protein